MSHTIQDKKKLLNRVKRIRGQIDAIERALEQERDCVEVLQQIAGCRGAMNGLLAVVLEEHIRTHLVDADFASGKVAVDSKEQLIDVVHSYFK
jgi:DNA-binding FrmR family transcriptional regulator